MFPLVLRSLRVPRAAVIVLVALGSSACASHVGGPATIPASSAADTSGQHPLAGSIFAGACPCQTLLHDFVGSDGESPQAPLIGLTNLLYGTTTDGGANGLGTVFSITPSGTETVVHSFGGGSGGTVPEAGALVNVDGILYGTTYLGGGFGEGVVFNLTPSGTETVIHAFGKNAGDGSNPYGGLTDVDGVLYGTTAYGGTSGDGTVFSVTLTGKETVLYSFGGHDDGINPQSTLVDISGVLYGTTTLGGKTGFGTVFSISTAGTEKVLHSFSGGNDGHTPGGLVALGSLLYGATEFGGNYGQGSLYSITTHGAKTLLYSFGKTGGLPSPAALIVANGLLYGTTVRQNATVFSVTPAGKETVLYTFGTEAGGEYPSGGVTDVGGTLYGTTQLGGSHSFGTVFSLKL